VSDLSAYVNELRARAAEDAQRSGVAASAIDQAASHAALGLPLPKRTRGRRLKQAVVRTTRVITHRQVAYNDAVLSALGALDTELAQVRAELGGRLAIALHGVEALRNDLQQHTNALHEVQVQLARQNDETRTAQTMVGSVQAMVAALEFELDATASRLDDLCDRVGAAPPTAGSHDDAEPLARRPH
jgi:hypothetical protein